MHLFILTHSFDKNIIFVRFNFNRFTIIYNYIRQATISAIYSRIIQMHVSASECYMYSVWKFIVKAADKKRRNIVHFMNKRQDLFFELVKLN